MRGTPGLLRPFGVEPLHGSLAPTGGTTQGAVVLGHSLWKEKFEGDPEAVGSTVSVNDETIPVIGVMPSDFSFPGSEEFWSSGPEVAVSCTPPRP